MENPSQHQLDKIMEGPRVWSRYFDEQISERFPSGGRDLQSEAREATSLRSLLGQLQSYQKHWSHKFIIKTTKQFRQLAPMDEADLSSYNELTFHVISQHIMSHWQRVFNPYNAPGLDERNLVAAQIKLAIESVELQFYAQEQAKQFEDGTYVVDQINDIDVMIALVQLMLDAEIENVHGFIATPAPLLPADNTRGTHFLAFIPGYDGEYTPTSVPSEVLSSALRTPSVGTLAQAALRQTKVSELSRWPEFSDINAFMSAKLRLPRDVDDRGVIEEARARMGQVVGEYSKQ